MNFNKKMSAIQPLLIITLVLLVFGCGNYKKADIAPEELAETTAFAEKFMKYRMEKSENNYQSIVEDENKLLSDKFLERFKIAEGNRAGDVNKAYLEEKLFGLESRRFKSFELGTPITKALGENSDGKLFGTALGVTYRVTINLVDEYDKPAGTFNETILIVKEVNTNNKLAIDDFVFDDKARQVM